MKTKRVIIKSESNNGDLAKQYFWKASNPGMDESLIVLKYILSSNIELYGDYLDIVKEFNGKYLFRQVFSIKLSTLKESINLLKIK